MSKIAVFIEKDGMSISNVPVNNDPGRTHLNDGGWNALSRLYETGCELVVVSNQPDMSPGYFPESMHQNIYDHIRALVNEKENAELSAFYYMPHVINGHVSPSEPGSTYRKSQPDLILRAAFDLDLDLRRSWMIGDTLNSIEAGRRAGCHTILISNGNETEWKLSPERQPHFILSNLDEAARTIISILKYKNEDLFALDVDIFSLMVE